MQIKLIFTSVKLIFQVPLGKSVVAYMHNNSKVYEQRLLSQETIKKSTPEQSIQIENILR
jgi:hypothetical protein